MEGQAAAQSARTTRGLLLQESNCGSSQSSVRVIIHYVAQEVLLSEVVRNHETLLSQVECVWVGRLGWGDLESSKK